MTHKSRLHALRACVSETLFTLSDWLFDAGYRMQPRDPVYTLEEYAKERQAIWSAMAIEFGRTSEGKDT